MKAFSEDPKQQILDWAKLKKFAGDNFKFDGKGGNKHCGKRRNSLSEAIYPFPTVSSKDL